MTFSSGHLGQPDSRRGVPEFGKGSVVAVPYVVDADPFVDLGRRQLARVLRLLVLLYPVAIEILYAIGLTENAVLFATGCQVLLAYLVLVLAEIGDLLMVSTGDGLSSTHLARPSRVHIVSDFEQVGVSHMRSHRRVYANGFAVLVDSLSGALLTGAGVHQVLLNLGVTLRSRP
ncbi:MAG: hypothetical protein ACJAZO_000404 [Myxococcota bacterium]|jgi:hypothetical protein